MTYYVFVVKKRLICLGTRLENINRCFIFSEFKFKYKNNHLLIFSRLVPTYNMTYLSNKHDIFGEKKLLNH